MTKAPEKIWAFTNGFLKNWSSHGEGKTTTEYTRTDIANAAVVDLVAQNAELIKRIAELEADK
tara:strand:+ start:930 stop:1118 length:189 start_codon:yes stop_codon:yes gene_type:complete